MKNASSDTEQMFRRTDKRVCFLCVVISFLLPTLWIILWRYDSAIYREHGPMENFQVAALALGMILLLSNLCRAVAVIEKLIMAGLSLLFLTFILLEFDTRSFDAPLLRRFTNGTIRNLWLGGLWLAVGGMAVKHRRALFSVGRHWLRSPGGFFMLIAGGFWIAGWITDKFHRFDDQGMAFMVEELNEVNATSLMLIAAVLTLIWLKNRKENETAA